MVWEESVTGGEKETRDLLVCGFFDGEKNTHFWEEERFKRDGEPKKIMLSEQGIVYMVDSGEREWIPFAASETWSLSLGRAPRKEPSLVASSLLHRRVRQNEDLFEKTFGK